MREAALTILPKIKAICTSLRSIFSAVSTGTSTISGYTFVGGVSDSIEVTVLNENDFSILTSTIPDGYVGISYEAIFASTDENASWSLLSGELPDGLSLSESGRLTGTPTAFGTFNLIIQAESSLGESETQEYTLTIENSNQFANQMNMLGCLDMVLKVHCVISA